MNYRELKTETEFLKKLIANLVSRFGDSLDAIVFTWMVYTLTGSASLTATTFAVNTLVSVLLTPFSAALITNWNLKTVMVVCDIGRGAMVTLTGVLFGTGILQPWMVIVITGLNSVLEAFRNPASMAVFPKIISREKYALGMSLSGGLSRAMELIGMGLAGVFISLLGIAGVLLIDAVMFIFSALILATLKLPPQGKEAAGNAFEEFVRNTKEGFLYAKKHNVVLAISLCACFLNFALTPISALQAPFVSESLKLGAEALSAMGVALSAGMGLGSLLVPKLLTKTSRFHVLFWGSMSISLSFLCVSLLPGLPILIIWVGLIFFFLVLGLGAGLANTVVQVAFMEKIHEDYLARMSGIMGSLCLAAMPVASFLSAALAKWISVPQVIMVFAILAVLGTFGTRLVKPLREL